MGALGPPRPAYGWIGSLAALGVVFGDIGTSPLYALGTVFTGTGAADRVVVLGVASMVVWSITLVVTILYVRILLRFDNDGEGGLLALLALLRRENPRRVVAVAASGLAILGAAMFLGDSMITPAISVLSAVEGVTVVAPDLHVVVVPITVVILGALFVVQRAGTARIGVAFGPIMLCWFLVAAVLGAVSTARTPSVLWALSPHWIVQLVAQRPWTAFLALGGVVLAITGAEALFADLGHFGRTAITRSWLVVVFPALVLSYLGQAAGVLRDPQRAANPFYGIVPGWATGAMVVLATAATIIASQAVISGAFSVVQQAGRLELLPLPRIVHTSLARPGQVYLPLVNALLAAAVIGLVLGFGSAAGLAAAYGIAVTLAIGTTTSLLVLLLVARGRLWTVRAFVAAAILAVICVFAVANLTKIATGGWVPLSVGLALVVVMGTWSRGQRHLDAVRARVEESLPDAVLRVREMRRVDGCTLYLTEDPDRAPGALTAELARPGALTASLVVLVVQTTDSPYGRDVSAEVLDPGFVLVRVRFGYRQRADIVEALHDGAPLLGLDPDALARATYVLSSDTPVEGPTLPAWQQRIFLTLTHANWPVERAYRLPADRTIIVGRELAL